MAIIYFDQMVWINFLKCQKGITPYSTKYNKVYQKVIETSDSNKHKYPISACHLMESIKRADLTSRKDLLELIFKVSKFYSISPWTEIYPLEIINAVAKSLGEKPFDISKDVFGDWTDKCFLQKMEIVFPGDSSVPDEVKESFRAVLKDPKAIAEALSHKSSSDNLTDQDKKLAEKFEKIRQTEYTHKDKQMRKKIAFARFFVSELAQELAEITSSLPLDVEKYAKDVFSNEEKINNFVKDVPAAYVLFILNYARNTNKSRKIEPNDFYDLNALAAAIPYCDIVVTEREWANILIDNGIDKLYDTIILYEVEKLEELL
jgi:hypothetical protein